MEPKLEIIITHWREPWVVCEKMFQMMDVQRAMTREECAVTVVQDGETRKMDAAMLMRRYPFVQRVIHVPEGGVSAARNAGLDEAKGEWVMFADCDDMLYSADSLRRILDTIRDKGDGADLIWGHMVIENRDKAGRYVRSVDGWNLTFIHGKIWRRAWLKEKKIRFPEGMAYSEDSFFCAVAGMELEPGRVKEIPEPIWMWCLRAGSCTSSPENEGRNREHIAWHRVMLPKVAMERKPEEAPAKAWRGICDACVEFASGKIPEEKREKLAEYYTRELIIPWEEDIGRMNPEEKEKILGISCGAARGMYGFGGAVNVQRWMARMKKKYGFGGAADDPVERAEPDAGAEAEAGGAGAEP